MASKFLDFVNSNNSLITLIFSFLVTTSTVVYAYLTRKLVNETIIMRRIQTDPKLIADIIQTPEHPYLLNMLLENVGNGVAINVKFKVKSEPELKTGKKISQYGFIQNGIKSIPGKSKYKTFFCSTIEEGMDFLEKEINLDILYEDQKHRKYKESIVFDLTYLKDVIYIQTDPLQKISKSMTEIENSLKKISNK